jgi:uncharacterized protein (DUF58 family)
MTDAHVTNRWRGIVAVALIAGGVGTIAQRPSLVLVGVLGVVFATYPELTSAPDPELSLERSLDPTDPGDGERVTVQTTVTNVGGGVLPDVRIVDGVPPALSVVDGSPRRGAVLRPGASVTFEYAVEAKQGKHAFEPASVAVRDLPGAREVETSVGTDTDIDCTVDLGRAPVRGQTLDVVGRVQSEQIGRGIEFDRTREYERGDEMNRIDWKRFARTGELTTIEFRVERAVSAVCLVDARTSAYRGTDDGHHAVAACVSAAEQLVATFVSDRNRAGLAAFGREFVWVAPDNGREHLVDVQRTVGASPTFLPTAPRSHPPLEEQMTELRRRLPSEGQVVLLSPLCDDAIVDQVRRLDASGHAVTVITPDVTGTDTLGERLANVERRNRLSRLRANDVQVVEWPLDAMLSATLAAAPGVAHT